MTDVKPVQRITRGAVLHRAALYDWQVCLLTLGRERALRERILGLARLAAGEAVLDVGCGTGTLAIAAKRLVGTAGDVCAIDASAEMLARANKKAARAGVAVAFERAVTEALPFPDARFDVVLTTLMLHHLFRRTRQDSVREMRRVVRPGGRVLPSTSPSQLGREASSRTFIGTVTSVSPICES